MQKHYLITGGLGLIGSALANAIDTKTTILTRSTKNKKRLKRKDVKIVVKDLNNISTNDLGGTDVIFHCASTVHNYHVLDDPFIDTHTNIVGTTKLLEACKKLKKKPKIIYLSTFFVYGNTYEKTGKPITEDSPTDPLAIYPATKLCTESIIKLYGKLYNIPYIICRLTNVYGEHEHFDNKKKGALNYLIMQAVLGKELSIYRGGNFFRDYLHVDDLVDALLFLESRAENELFLIGQGTPVKFSDIIKELLRLTGNKSKVTQIPPPRFHDIVGITNFIADTRKINSLGWKAKIDYRQGIKKIVTHYETSL